MKAIAPDGNMKAIALAVSARERGNCYDFAQFVLKYLREKGVETELINFYDYRITPCQNCNYECLQSFDPEKGVNAECPIQDDVKTIWRKIWDSEILLIFVPTYGGLPPALLVAFLQRTQAFSRGFPTDKLKDMVLSCVVLASPHWSGIAEFTPVIMSEEVRWMGRKVAAFEVINNAGFETENLFGGLINEEEIRRRLEFLADRTYAVAKKTLP